MFRSTSLLSVWSFSDVFWINGAAHLNSPDLLVRTGRKVPMNDDCKILNYSGVRSNEVSRSQCFSVLATKEDRPPRPYSRVWRLRPLKSAINLRAPRYTVSRTCKALGGGMRQQDITEVQRRCKSGGNQSLFTLKRKARFYFKIKTQFQFQPLHQLLNMRCKEKKNRLKTYQDTCNEVQSVYLEKRMLRTGSVFQILHLKTARLLFCVHLKQVLNREKRASRWVMS